MFSSFYLKKHILNLKGCIWYEGGEEGEPWCYTYSEEDEEHSLGSSERDSLKNDYGVKITNAAIRKQLKCDIEIYKLKIRFLM